MVKKGQPKKKKRLKLRVNVVLKLLLFIGIVSALITYSLNLRIKNIYIVGNNTTKDVEIIEMAGIKDYPLVKNLKVKKIKNNINSLPLITNTKISINPFGKITIKVEETNILFFYKYNNKYITASNESIEDKNYYGYPTLINFTPDTIFDKLVIGLTKVDYDIIRMINEIEYTPYKSSEGNIIDDELFTLKMNDGNTVMIDIVNIKNLNKYETIYASLGMDQNKGIVYLDTIIDERLLFTSYDTIKEETEITEEEKENKEEQKEQ